MDERAKRVSPRLQGEGGLGQHHRHWSAAPCPLLDCWIAWWPLGRRTSCGAQSWSAAQLAARCGSCSAPSGCGGAGGCYCPRCQTAWSTTSSPPPPMCGNHKSHHRATGSGVVRSHGNVATRARVLHISGRQPASLTAWRIAEKAGSSCKHQTEPRGNGRCRK